MSTSTHPVLPAAPDLPSARGPLSDWLIDVLQGSGRVASPVAAAPADPIGDEDLQLALYCLYELAYRGFAGVDAAKEDEPAVLALRRQLEGQFERAVRDATASRPIGVGDGEVVRAVDALLRQSDGPSLSSFLEERGTASQFREFLVHRSAYQLKEADPHTWVIPRLRPGARKGAFVEIQSDEYGNGRPGASHAELFGRALRAAGLDERYGAHIDALPAETLATGNLISMFGLHRRFAGAAVGHLAVFEMTSVEPMGRYAHVCDRLGFGPDVRAFYDVHVEADDHHGRLARAALLGPGMPADGLDPDDVVFGAAALVHVERRFTEHLLSRWTAGRGSLRPVEDAAAA